jgi:hypothetical protein
VAPFPHLPPAGTRGGAVSRPRGTAVSRAADHDAGAQDRLVAGLVFALAAVDDGIVTLRHDRIEPVAVLLDAIRGRCELRPDRVRVAVRLAPELPADRVRAEVASRLGVDAATIVTGRASTGAHRDLDLRVDVRDAAAATLVGAWLAGAWLEGGPGASGGAGPRAVVARG